MGQGWANDQETLHPTRARKCTEPENVPGTFSASAAPFPLGKAMPPTSTEFGKKTQAKTDLTPAADGRAPRTCYWARSLTERHELFHVTNWREGYYKPKAQEAETWIESQEVAVTVANLVPDAALTAKKPDLHAKLIEKSDEAQREYAPDKETRAYDVGKASYQALAASIVP